MIENAVADADDVVLKWSSIVLVLTMRKANVCVYVDDIAVIRYEICEPSVCLCNSFIEMSKTRK